MYNKQIFNKKLMSQSIFSVKYTGYITLNQIWICIPKFNIDENMLMKFAVDFTFFCVKCSDIT